MRFRHHAVSRCFSENQEIPETLWHHGAKGRGADPCLLALVCRRWRPGRLGCSDDRRVGLATWRRGGDEVELESLRLQVRSLDEELLRYRSTVGTEQNAVQMERSTPQRLLDRVRALELENAVLKEDILLFERLTPAAGEEGAICLENFGVVAEGTQNFCYRVLISFHSGKQAPEFRGRLEFLVTFVQRGKSQEVVIPSGRERAGEFQVEVRNFLREEGSFELPAGAPAVGGGASSSGRYTQGEARGATLGDSGVREEG